MPAFNDGLGKKETLKINRHLCVAAHAHTFSKGCYSFFFFSPIFFFPLIARHFISFLNQGDTAQTFSKLTLRLQYHISSTDPSNICTRTLYLVSLRNLSCSESSTLIYSVPSTAFLFNLLCILIFIHIVLDYKNHCID